MTLNEIFMKMTAEEMEGWAVTEELLQVILPACISAVATLLVCLITNRGQLDRTRILMEYKLDELAKKVDKHNNLIERTYKLEKETSVMHEQILVANHRIKDLESRESET